jgi:hypothetical protein
MNTEREGSSLASTEMALNSLRNMIFAVLANISTNNNARTTGSLLALRTWPNKRMLIPTPWQSLLNVFNISNITLSLASCARCSSGSSSSSSSSSSSFTSPSPSS